MKHKEEERRGEKRREEERRGEKRREEERRAKREDEIVGSEHERTKLLSSLVPLLTCPCRWERTLQGYGCYSPLNFTFDNSERMPLVNVIYAQVCLNPQFINNISDDECLFERL